MNAMKRRGWPAKAVVTSVATLSLLMLATPDTAQAADAGHRYVPLASQVKMTATATITVKTTTQRMSGGSLKSTQYGTLKTGQRTTAGCKITGQNVHGHYGWSNLWFDTPLGWLPDADVLANINVGYCVTRRAIGARESTNSAPYGQCTYWAKARFRQKTGAFPALYGNAMQWLASARDAGYTTVLDAQANSIVVFQPGVQGASSVGHVAYVEQVDQRSDGRWIYVSEWNYNNTGAVLHNRWVKDAVGMSYILAA